jgi:hypothetical protein
MGKDTIKTFESVSDYLSFYNFSLPVGYLKVEEVLSRSCRSSYIENHFGRIFFALTYKFQFKNILELGVLDGFSLLSMAFGSYCNNDGKLSNINGVDLFEDYKYRKGEMASVQKLAHGFAFGMHVKLIKNNIFKNNFNDDLIRQANLIHVDLSNDRDKVEKVMLKIKSDPPSMIIFEGGSYNRDKVEWMVRFQKNALRPFFEEVHSIGTYKVEIIDCFPSMTILTLIP